MKVVVPIIFMMFIAFVSAFSHQEENIRLVGQITFPDLDPDMCSFSTRSLDLRDIHVSGKIAYIAGEYGFRLVDISQTSKPKAIGFYHVGIHDQEYVRAVDTFNDFIYAVTTDGFLAVDLNTIPMEAEFYDGFYGTEEILAMRSTVKDDRLYVAYNTKSSDVGLFVLDISIPEKPKRMGSVKFNDTSGMLANLTVFDNLSYIADIDNGIRVVDISIPSNPKQIKILELSSDPLDVIKVDDNFAYAIYWTRNSGGVMILDIGDPTDPKEIGKYDISGKIFGISIRDNLAYVVQEMPQNDSELGIAILDIGIPWEPKVLGLHSVGNYYDRNMVYNVNACLSGNIIYIVYENISHRHSMLDIFSINAPLNPEKIGSFEIPAGLRGIDNFIVSNNIAYIIVDGIHLVDISLPSNSKYAGFYRMPCSIRAFTELDGFLYIHGTDGLRLVDTRMGPMKAKYYEMPETFDVAVSNRYAYIATKSGLQIMDVSNPLEAEKVAFHETPYRVPRVSVTGELASIVYYNENDNHTNLQVLDIRSPSAPEVIGNYILNSRTKSPYDVEFEVLNNVAYFSTGAAFWIYKLFPIAGVQVLGNYESDCRYCGLTTGPGVDILAYIKRRKEIHVVDVTSPANSVRVGLFKRDGYYGDIEVDVSGGYIYSAMENGLDILRYEGTGDEEKIPIVGDVNEDGLVNMEDLLFVASHFGEKGDNTPKADVDRDGIVDILDIILVASQISN